MTSAVFSADLRGRILPLRRQAEITDAWLRRRLQTILPALMNECNIDLWIVVSREYNEDPLMPSLLPAEVLSSRRRTILVFQRTSPTTAACLHWGKPRQGLDEFYEPRWDPQGSGQWEALAAFVKEVDPAAIAVNICADNAFGDGLTKSQYDEMAAALGPEMTDRITTADPLAVGWLQRRSPEELLAYDGIVDIAHQLIRKMYSLDVIHPGLTSAADAAWWLRQAINDLGLHAWFQPTVMIQRRGLTNIAADQPILPGDLLHCDVGLHYLGLATDTQQMAYVLRPGEAEAPQEIAAALGIGNRLQDIFTGEFAAGRSGNDIFAAALKKATEEGIEAMIYTHPIGVHGHGAGPIMGLFDQQTFVAGRGEYPLAEDTCYAVELNIKTPLQCWEGQEVMIALEQTAAFSSGAVRYFAGRQTALHCIG